MIDLKTKAHYDELEEYGFGPNIMKKIKVCSNCGSVNSSEFEICNICESILPQETLFQKYVSMHKMCSECGCIVRVEAKYCPQCRALLKA